MIRREIIVANEEAITSLGVEHGLTTGESYESVMELFERINPYAIPFVDDEIRIPEGFCTVEVMNIVRARNEGTGDYDYLASYPKSANSMADASVWSGFVFSRDYQNEETILKAAKAAVLCDVSFESDLWDFDPRIDMEARIIGVNYLSSEIGDGSLSLVCLTETKPMIPTSLLPRIHVAWKSLPEMATAELELRTQHFYYDLTRFHIEEQNRKALGPTIRAARLNLLTN